MNTLEKVLINRAQNGTYHKEELIEIAKKLWIEGDISESVKDQALEIIAEREDCEPPVTPETRLEDVESTLGVLLGTGEAEDDGERARQTRALMMQTAQALPDEQAMELPALFPEWESGVSYAQDDRICYQNQLYKCLQGHTSQDDWTPDTAVSLWVAVSDPAEEWPQWKQPSGAHDAYPKGAKVTRNGKRYTSNVDGNTWEPPTQWTEFTEEK